MNYKDVIIIVPGEPNSIFFEILFKSLKKIKNTNPIILIASEKILRLQMKKLKFKIKIKLIDKNNINLIDLKRNYLNLINVEYKNYKSFEKISVKSNNYITECFNLAFKIIKKYKIIKFINGPINKKTFLKGSFPGITEFISSRFKVNKNAMLIYTKKLSVCPITTHIPIKLITKKINKTLITDKVKLINNFYKSILKKTPKIALLGLNPHCESFDNFDEDIKIIKPTVNFLKKKRYNVTGPISADTIFLKQNRSKYDVIVGMYHDQVLTPIKTLFEYKAINITLGLPFIRISPDHGPNEKMVGKNLSDPSSIIQAIKFLETH